MTVKQLKEKLEEYPDDYEITLVDCETACLYHAKDIKLFKIENNYLHATGCVKASKTLYIE